MHAENPWKTDDWFVSPWDYMDETIEGFALPEKVLIQDATLRDGEQQAHVVFREDDKVRIAESLAELGVQRLEAGWVTVSPHDEAAVRRIVKRNLGFKVFCPSRGVEEDIRLTLDCGVDGIRLTAPGSDLLRGVGLGWTREKAIGVLANGTRLARQLGAEHIQISIVDGTRTEMSSYLDMFATIVREGEVDSVVLTDTMGTLTPQAVAMATTKLRQATQRPVEAHFHNDYGFGVANAIQSVLAGAEVIHCTVNGIGERAGNTPLEETVLALRTLYGIDVGIDYGKLREVAKLVEELSGVPMLSNRGFVGDMAYHIESGMPVDEYRTISTKLGSDVANTASFAVHHRFVGSPEPYVVLGKMSGRGNVLWWADKLGIVLEKDEVSAVVAVVKERAYELGHSLDEAQFRQIVAEVRAKS